MTTDRDFVLETMRNYGMSRARVIQENASEMTKDELNESRDFEPSFKAACETMNMLKRKPGFICVSSAGRVVKLLQVYDSSVYTQEPEELPAQWGFVWSTNPDYALPFIALSTSPYMKDDVCSETTGEGEEAVTKIYRSKIDNNVWAPNAAPTMWEFVR